MHQNQLCSMPALEPVKATLRLLSLTSVAISQFPNNYFINFTRNDWTDLPWFKWLEKSIQEIQITHNKIQSLDAITAHGFYESLHYLDTSYNMVHHLNVSHMERFPKLTELVLSGNQLTAMGDYRAYLHSGAYIIAVANPCHCDAKLTWMTGLDSSHLTCHSPECFAGKYVNEISEYRSVTLQVPFVQRDRWLSARLQYLQCVSTGDTAVLHQTIKMSKHPISTSQTEC